MQAELKSELMRAHPNALIDIRNPQQLFAVMLKQRHTFNALLISIAVMALLMGGVGIMNILWVAVNERRSEIGLRLALGARKRDIAQLFLMEALLLSVVGGMLGVLSGQLGVFLLARGLHWSFSANVIACGAGFAVALIVGIVAGSYPAYRAAQAQPMEILFN